MPTESADLLLPIGRYLGIFGTAAPAAKSYYGVRTGHDTHQLSAPEFQLWSTAHGHPSRTVAGWTTDDVLAGARMRRIPEPELIVDNLRSEGLLVAVAPSLESVVDFAYDHRIYPLLLGLGNTVAEPGTYSFGLVGRPLVGVDSIRYELIRWAQLDANLWDACLHTAAAARAAGRTGGLETNPDQLLIHLLRGLHGLLSAGAVCLEIAGNRSVRRRAVPVGDWRPEASHAS